MTFAQDKMGGGKILKKQSLIFKTSSYTKSYQPSEKQNRFSQLQILEMPLIYGN